MNLAAERVKELQYFLMDAAKRYAAPHGTGKCGPGELLSNAAALDYLLLLSSERPGELADSSSPVVAGVRETTQRAVLAALDVGAAMLAAPDDIFSDFFERHVREGKIFETFRALRESGVLTSNDVAFRVVTTENDLRERKCS